MEDDNKHWFLSSLLNSYAQVFFSDHRIFAGILMVVTFLDPFTGLYGLLAVISTNLMAWRIGFDKRKISRGYYGFNALLAGLGLGVLFSPGLLLTLVIVLAAILTLFISVALEGIIGKYALPYLSLPFVFCLWILLLASREFHGLGISERGIYTLNELFMLGGQTLVDLYNWWNAIEFPYALIAYLRSLSAIFFQSGTLAGLLIAAGLLIYSRISFSLSLLGFFMAYLFYAVIGYPPESINYSYIGFNYILTAIAAGGYFVIPHRSSYLWTALLIPLVALLTISMSMVFAVFHLPIYSLPFNIITLLFLYILKFRTHDKMHLNTWFVQQHSPERNLYANRTWSRRFGKDSPVPLFLPFMGKWCVTQSHDGEHTHKGHWKNAWDFEIRDQAGKTFRGSGDLAEDYFCYGKPVCATADGIIDSVTDGIDDNIIGQRNLEQNWGNTVVIRHTEFLYSQLSHLKTGSISVKPGQKISKGEVIALCGNSGNSPYPHLHFQVQGNPHIGSPTLDYALSNYIVYREAGVQIRQASVPQLNDEVSNIIPDPQLKKALRLTPGEEIRFASEGRTIVWEVKRDYYLNKYIECTESRSKAYFRNDDAMLYFTHYTGKRGTLLHHFAMAAYQVCLGPVKGLDIEDEYPLNMAFSDRNLLLHDFTAPFFFYKKAGFKLRYQGNEDPFRQSGITLESESRRRSPFRKYQPVSYRIITEAGEMRSFEIITPGNKLEAICQ